MRERGECVLAVDLGQRRDHTALVVVEAQARGRLDVRYAERMALGTPYREAARRIGRLWRLPELRGRTTLVVDATGVGRAVVEMLREETPDRLPVAVTITSGQGWRQTPQGEWHVAKTELMGMLQAGLERGEVRIAGRMAGAAALVDELTHLRARQKRTGGVELGALGEGEHDDLAVALALACWRFRVTGQQHWEPQRDLVFL
jgi:hypothetical protein